MSLSFLPAPCARPNALIALSLSLIAAMGNCTVSQDKSTSSPVAKGEVVTELPTDIWHVFQAKNHDYWFGSHDHGAYRYNGKTLVKYTTKDGLSSNGIGGFQEDKAGNIYIASHGISKFDGQTFTTLSVRKDSASTDWKLGPDDLWFAGPTDSGVVYRYDGKSLHPVEFPKTKDGDRHYEEVPRSKYPNAKYSPYDVYTIFKDSKGNMWFGTATLGVCRYDGKSFAWLPESELGNGSFGTRAIIEDKDGKFWFCDTLHRYSVDLSGPARPKYTKEEGIRDAKDRNRASIAGIMSSTVDSAGAQWMATYGMGVFSLDGKILTHYPVLEGGRQIHLFSIYKDKQGVLWLGTQTSGIYKFNGKVFEKFKIKL
ncbi:MAG: two-component regulator propeller domain-containing protein [Planctomycetota bacterium]